MVTEKNLSESLIGAQFRVFPAPNWQIDGLISVLTGDEGNFGFGDAWEIGGATSVRFRHVTVGAIYIQFFDRGNDVPNVHTFGGTIKYNSPGSPTLYLGTLGRRNDNRLVFQVSYPIGLDLN